MRHAIVIAAVVVVGWVGFGLWWNWSLAGLPDIGDPFDVAEFERSRQVAPEDDAAPNYVRASGLLRRVIWFGRGREWNIQRWEEADPAKRRDLETDRAALDLWFQATEKPNCSTTGLPHPYQNWYFSELAALEASRLGATGDMAGAWRWYRAILQSTEHVTRGMPPHDRRSQLSLRAAVAEPITRWAADGRVDAETLRGALADLVAMYEVVPQEIDFYKATYLDLQDTIKSAGDDPTNYVGPDFPLLGRLPPATNRAWMPMRQEPERSKRVLRLILANWLAWASQPRASRPGPLPREEGDPILYPLAADAPASARTLPPERLIRWYRSSSYARFLYMGLDHENLCEEVIVRERAARARLIVAVAEQLYRREHGGHASPSREALVGPYLKRLPGGLDGPLPRFEE
ncbi:MAG TPA: hypothetical protein VG406_20070 [Isosphaeraceae bacterium]|nr:hypothetical protein [Isosphaeraceae bacterium]